MARRLRALIAELLPSPRRAVAAREAWPVAAFVLGVPALALAIEAWGAVLFTRPWALAWVGVAPWLWWLAVAGRTGLEAWRPRAAFAVRLAVLALLVVALAEPRSVRRSDALAMLFLLDHSKSIDDSTSKAAQKLIAKLATEKPPKDHVGVVAFAREAAVELSPGPTFPFDGLEVTQQLDRNGTDLAKALALAGAILPDDKQGRIALVSDGVATQGALDAALDQLKSRGVAVDVLEVSYRHEHEVLVERLDLPRSVKEGESYEAHAIVTAKTPGEGELVLSENGQVIHRGKVAYQPGRNRFTVPIRLRDSGYYEYTAQIEVPAGKDGWAENNRAIGYLNLEGEGRVMLVTQAGGDERDWQSLKQALERARRRVEVRTAAEFPADPLALLPYDAVAFVNVPRDAFADPQLEALKAAVGRQGTGFLMVGGENSFGPGGWHKTQVEEVLPVSMYVTQRKVLPKGALAIVLHTCEFPQGNAWAKQITKQAIKVLNAQDEAGVLAYDWNGGDKWIFNLMPVAEFPRMAQLINNAQIGDMPAFGPTMQLGFAALKPSDASSKHMILISDGDPQPPAPQLLQAYVDAKISVSTVAVFPHGNSVTVLQAIANATGGRFYFPQDPNTLPSIFIKEARTLKRSMIQNRTFTPELSFNSDILKGIRGLPPLDGYVLTTPKGGVHRMILKAPSEEDDEPVLALGNFGVGKSAAFTSDLSTNWGKRWVQWEQYQAFVQQLITEVARRHKQSSLRMQAFAAGDQGQVLVEDFAPEAPFRDVVARVIGPNNAEQTLVLRQTAARRYEARFPLQGEGRYQVIALSREGQEEERVNGGFVVPYAQEFVRFRSDPITLQRIADRTGGRVLSGEPNAQDLFKVDRQTKTSSRPIFDRFLWLLCFLVLLDVAMRRVQIDLATLRGLFGATRASRPDDATFAGLLRTKKSVKQGLEERSQEPRPMTPAYEVPPLDAASQPPADPAGKAPSGASKPTGPSVTSRLLAAKRKVSPGGDEPPPPPAPR